MIRPRAPRLTKKQTRLVQQYAEDLPPSLRDSYLNAVNKMLAGQPSDLAVEAAASIASSKIMNLTYVKNEIKNESENHHGQTSQV